MKPDQVVIVSKIKDAAVQGDFKIALTFMAGLGKWGITNVGISPRPLPRGARVSVLSVPAGGNAVKHRWNGPDGRTQGGFNGSTINELSGSDENAILLVTRVVPVTQPAGDLTQDQMVFRNDPNWTVFGPPVPRRGDVFHVMSFNPGANNIVGGNVAQATRFTAGSSNPVVSTGTPFVTEVFSNKPTGYVGLSNNGAGWSPVSLGRTPVGERVFNLVTVDASPPAPTNVSVQIVSSVVALVFKTEPGQTEALAIPTPTSGAVSVSLPPGSDLRIVAADRSSLPLVRTNISTSTMINYPAAPSVSTAQVTVNFAFPILVFKTEPGKQKEFVQQTAVAGQFSSAGGNDRDRPRNLDGPIGRFYDPTRHPLATLDITFATTNI